MLKPLAAIGLIIAATTPSFGALPPQYQRQEELGAIIASMEVLNALGGGEIDKIEYIDFDLYRVTSGRCSVDVRIIDVPPKPGEEMMVGPRQFVPGVGTATCQ